MPRLALVGAGIAGCAAAYALRNADDLHLTVFEKSRGVSGRAATRRRGDVRYDHGANYLQLDGHPNAARVVREELPTEDLVAIESDVWVHTDDGEVQPGDPERNRKAKWTYRQGISRLGKLLLAETKADVQLQAHVASLKQARDGWLVATTDGTWDGPFDGVLLNPPAPQTRMLLSNSDFQEVGLRNALADGLREAAYRTQLAVVLGYDAPLQRPGDFYALVNPSGGHDVAWLGFEEDKPGHVPAGQSVLVLQMAPAWSEAHYDADAEALAEAAAPLAAALLGGDQALDYAWCDRQGWRYALPDAAADTEALAQGAGAGLFFCGDGMAGRGRVAAALENGLAAADQVREVLKER